MRSPKVTVWTITQLIKMEEQENLHDQIERYLSGEMNADELNAFEESIRNDRELENEVALHREIATAALENDVIEFREIVNSAISENSEEPVFLQQNNRKYLLIAASISLLLLALWGVSTQLKTPTSQELYSSYYEPYDDLITGRSDKLADERLSEFMSFYNSGQYDSGIALIKEINIAEKPLLQLYTGICFLNTNQFDQAINHFTQVSANGGMLGKQGLWYLAMAQLKNNDLEKATESLKIIISSGENSLYNAKAIELLEKIKN
ncbi:MAG: hypothetical protein AAFQ94_15810 [Bacteroidota bacterium]